MPGLTGSEPRNHGQPWRDDDIRLVLSFKRTKVNCELLGKILERTPSGIDWIYSWIDPKKKWPERAHNKVGVQVKKVARALRKERLLQKFSLVEE